MQEMQCGMGMQRGQPQDAVMESKACRTYVAVTAMLPRQVKRIMSHQGRTAGLGRALSGSVGLRRLPACDTCTIPRIMTLSPTDYIAGAARGKFDWVVGYGGGGIRGVRGWER